MKLTSLQKTKPDDGTRRKEAILDGIFDVKDRLETAFSIFNNVSDPELIEACIYEINSLQSRYAYFLNRAREEGVEMPPVFKKRPQYD